MRFLRPSRQTLPSRSELVCGAFLPYPPGDSARSDAALANQKLIWAIKGDKPLQNGRMAIDFTIDALHDHIPDTILDGFFDGALLVPLPSSRKKAPQAPFHWPSRRICEVMISKGLGADMDPCIIRAKGIRSSKGCRPEDRPTIDEHLETLALEGEPLLIQPNRVILVDDVLTRGTTMLAASEIARRRFANAPIAGFAIGATILGAIPFTSRVQIRMFLLRRSSRGGGWRSDLTDDESRGRLQALGW